MPLLAMLLCGAPAAAQTLDELARKARAAIDRTEWGPARQIVDEGLKRAKGDQLAAWRVMDGILISQQNPKKGREILEQELPPSLRTTEIEVRRLIRLAYLAGREQQDAEADRYLAAALDVAEKHAPAVVPNVYLAGASSGSGDREANAKQAIQLARARGDKIVEARAMAALALSLIETRTSEAIDWGEQALVLARELDLKKTVNQIEGNIGWAYVTVGQLDNAHELLTQAEATATREGERAIWLLQLGNVHYYRREWPAAERFYRQVIQREKDAAPADVGSAKANLAIIAVENDRFEEARRLNAEARELKRGAKDAALRSDIIDARISAATGDTATAQQILRRVIAEAQTPRTLWEAQGRLGEVFVRNQQTADAIEQFKRAIETAGNARKNVAEEGDRLAYFTILAQIFDSYIDFLIDQERFEDALAVTEISRAQTLEEGLGVAPSARRVSAKAVAKAQNATLLCYWLGGRRSYVWTVTATDVRVQKLRPGAEIEARASAYRRDFNESVLMPPRGQLLYSLLVAPAVANLPRDARVIVLPDRGLHALNFETLIVPGPRPHFWIEDVVVMHASSLQLLARPDAPSSRGARMLLIGDPPQADPKYPALKYAGQEIDYVASHFPQRTVLRGPKATPAAYRDAAPAAYDFVHFVAHGVAPVKQPLESAVILGPDASKNYKLLARDVIQQPLNARLVTIASCHGAGTRAYAGEGLVGLAWAFLRAGSSNVIAALWEVNDKATPKLMDRLYREITAGRDPAVALRNAKLELIRSGYTRPLSWGPFVLYAGS